MRKSRSVGCDRAFEVCARHGQLAVTEPLKYAHVMVSWL